MISNEIEYSNANMKRMLANKKNLGGAYLVMTISFLVKNFFNINDLTSHKIISGNMI